MTQVTPGVRPTCAIVRTAIAEYLHARLVPGEDLRVEGQLEFDVPPEGVQQFSADDLPWSSAPTSTRGVWLRSDWLEAFRAFCSTSQGIGAVQEGIE